MSTQTTGWRGVFTAIVTPFREDGSLDLESFEALLADQISSKVAGVVVCGTTGESPTLTHEEKEILFRTAKNTLQSSSLKLIAGTGGNSTAETIELSRFASNLGVDGLLLVTPYYNKPTQKGLIEHFKAVADEVACDCILYNVPSRTSVSVTAETVAELAEHPRIRAIKEATGNLQFLSEISDKLRANQRSMSLLSGDDPTFLPALSVGATGIISVASNVIPKAMNELFEAYMGGSPDHARKIHEQIFPLLRDLFIETNPVPVKRVLAQLGVCLPKTRLPLVSLTAQSEARLATTWSEVSRHK